MARLVLLVAFCLTAAGCGGGSSSETAAVTTTAPSAPTAKAPRLAGTTIDGEQLTLGDFRGRPVLVNVWSSW